MSENKVTKSEENISAVGENLGLRKVKQLNGGLKKVKDSQKKIHKDYRFYRENFELLRQFLFFGRSETTPCPSRRIRH